MAMSRRKRRDATKKRLQGGLQKSAVLRFLARDRADFNLWRTKSDDWLERRQERLSVKPPIWYKLRREQQVGFIAGVQERKFCFWYDMGMGKTLLAIALARYFRKVRLVRSVIVLIPNKVNKGEWANEIRKHSPRSRYVILSGSSLHKWEQLEDALDDEPLFILETYGGLVRLLSSMVKVKDKKGMQLKPRPAKVKNLLKVVQGIVMDESIMVQKKDRHGSLIFRLCRKLAQQCKIAYALNGTPFGSDPTDMWGQFFVIDEGETLGQTLGLFRAAFFNETANYWGGTDYAFDTKKTNLLHEIIGNRSIRYEADESTLPRINMIPKYVNLPDDAEEYYAKAKEEIITARGSFTDLKNVFLRMRQISSGYIGYEDDELGERVKFEFDENPKLDMCESLVQGIVSGHKVVIFHEFTHSGNMLERMVKDLGVKCARLYGKTKDPEAQLVQFHDDRKTRVFILQNAAGGFGLDRLKVARYGIYFEAPVGTVLRQQTIRRIRRQGSDHSRVFLYDLVCRGTVDQQILDAHEAGIDLFKSVVEGKTKLN